MFGNTEVVAKAVAEGLSPHMSVKITEVGVAPTVIDDVRLLVVGGPTHALGLSRPGSRQDAAKQAGHAVISAGTGLREWLAAVRAGPATTTAAAAFDTRVRVHGLPGSAARAAVRRLRRRGFRVVAPAESFYVAGTPGPLLPDEADRARRWGDALGTAQQLSRPAEA
jgi:hypothetical protein